MADPKPVKRLKKDGVAFVALLTGTATLGGGAYVAWERLAGVRPMVIPCLVVAVLCFAYVWWQSRGAKDSGIAEERERANPERERAILAAKNEGIRIGSAERDHVLSDVLRVEAYCDPARGHGMFYSNKGIVIRFGIRVTNAGRRVVRPTEAENMQLIPRWNTQVALSSSEKSKRLRETQSIGYQESTDIGDFEVVAGQWNWVSPPPGGVFAMFEVSGTLLIDTGSKDEDAMTFGCDNLALPVTGSPESPCQLPDAALARVADVPSGSKLRVAPESGNQSVTESESESEVEAGEGGKRGRESGK